MGKQRKKCPPTTEPENYRCGQAGATMPEKQTHAHANPMDDYDYPYEAICAIKVSTPGITQHNPTTSWWIKLFAVHLV